MKINISTNTNKYSSFKAKLPLIKPDIKFIAENDPRKICSMPINHPVLGHLNLITKVNENDYFATEILKDSEKLAFDYFNMRKDTNYINDLSIKVQNHNLRQSGNRLGEKLRLVSIIEMLENNREQISLYSKDTAIYFHSKYGFLPKVESFECRDSMLLDMIKNGYADKNFKDIGDRANEIIKQTYTQKTNEAQRQFCVDTNELLKEYIPRVISEKNISDHQFTRGMPMVLKKETIKENPDKYNILFEKHRIDYNV